MIPGWLASGILLFLSFVPVAGHSLVAYFAFVPLFRRIETTRIKHFFFMGAIFWFLTLYWIPRTLNSYGNTGWPLAVLAYVLLALYLSLFFLLWGIIGRVARGNLWILAASFVFLEWLRSRVLYGFPLFMLAHTQVDFSFALQVASLLGQWGVSLEVALFSVLVARYRRFIPVYLALFFAVNGFLWLKTPEGNIPLKVAIVQPSLTEEEKWNPLMKEKNIETVVSMIKRACGTSPDLIITPETTFPFYWNVDSETYGVLESLEACPSYVLIGALSYEPFKNSYRLVNEAVLVKGMRQIKSYRKHILVPFGEFTPWGNLLKKLFPKVSWPQEFLRGKEPPIFSIDGERFVCGICYEMAFPEYINAFAKNADFLVNITNDMWFGKTIAPYAHLWAAALRAVENRKYLFRCANSGISAVISPKGRILESLPLMKRGILVFPKP